MESNTTFTIEELISKHEIETVYPGSSIRKIKALCDEYAAQQCAIVAAEKDKEIDTLKHEINAWRIAVSNSKKELISKYAECQRLREELNEACALLEEYTAPAKADVTTTLEKFENPIYGNCNHGNNMANCEKCYAIFNKPQSPKLRGSEG